MASINFSNTNSSGVGSRNNFNNSEYSSMGNSNAIGDGDSKINESCGNIIETKYTLDNEESSSKISSCYSPVTGCKGVKESIQIGDISRFRDISSVWRRAQYELVKSVLEADTSLKYIKEHDLYSFTLNDLIKQIQLWSLSFSKRLQDHIASWLIAKLSKYIDNEHNMSYKKTFPTTFTLEDKNGKNMFLMSITFIHKKLSTFKIHHDLFFHCLHIIRPVYVNLDDHVICNPKYDEELSIVVSESDVDVDDQATQ